MPKIFFVCGALLANGASAGLDSSAGSASVGVESFASSGYQNTGPGGGGRKFLPCSVIIHGFFALEQRIQDELSRPAALVDFRRYGNKSLWMLEPNSKRTFIEYAIALLYAHIQGYLIYSPLSIELETDVMTALARNHDFLEETCPPLAVFKSMCQVAVMNRGNILGLHQPVVQEQGARVFESVEEKFGEQNFRVLSEMRILLKLRW